MVNINDEIVGTKSRADAQPTSIVRRIINKDYDRASVLVILLSALTGILAGQVATWFEIGTDKIIELRHLYLQSFTGVQLLAMGFLISAVMGGIGYYLTHRFAPEAGGSGIPEIEGALDELRPVRWQRVIPVKFFGGLCTLGSGMVLGREGPSVQMGGNIGRMLSDIFKLDKDSAHALLAAGAAGGLAAAFNAPLAGILFVIEEMRPQFRYSFVSIKAVGISAVLATIVLQLNRGQTAIIELPRYLAPDLNTLWLYLVMGCFFGLFGIFFNKFVVTMQDFYLAVHKNHRGRFVAIGMLLSGIFGILSFAMPEVSGGGTNLIPHFSVAGMSFGLILALFIMRLIATVFCFSSGAPGGIFAPMLVLGTLFGIFFGHSFMALFPTLNISPGTFAIAGMGALFAATVRAPLTGIVLVTEMTDNYQLILPMMLTTLGATIVAQILGGKPIYSQILHRTLLLAMRQQKQQARQEAIQKLQESNIDS